MKPLIFMSILILILSSFSKATCLSETCDPTIEYAMDKHRVFVEERMNDFRTTIDAMNEATKSMNEVCLLENFELMRLKARLEIEAYKSVNARHYYQSDTKIEETERKNITTRNKK